MTAKLAREWGALMFDLHTIYLSQTVAQGHMNEAQWVSLIAERVSCQEMQQRTIGFLSGMGLGQSKREQECRDPHAFALKIVRAVLERSTEYLAARVSSERIFTMRSHKADVTDR